jgi:hypothetical protein
MFFRVLAPCELVVDANVSKKHTVSVFRAEGTALVIWKFVQSGRKAKSEEMGQSE